MTVVVWSVNPFVQECLSQQLSLQCGQSPVYMAALGPQLALTFQDPNRGSYNLMHFNLNTNSQTHYPPSEGHLDKFKGHRSRMSSVDGVVFYEIVCVTGLIFLQDCVCVLILRCLSPAV